MKFEEIKKDMVISYGIELYRVISYSKFHNKYWELKNMQTGESILIFIDDFRLPDLFEFDLNDLVSL